MSGDRPRLLHRHAQGEHAKDKEQDAPLDCAVGLIGCQASQDDHGRRGDDREGDDREHLEGGKDHHQQHGADRDWRLVAAERALTGLGQVDKHPAIEQPAQAFGWSLQQQRVAEGKPHLVEVAAKVLALPVNRENVDPIEPPKVEVSDTVPGETRLRPDDTLHDDDRLPADRLNRVAFQWAEDEALNLAQLHDVGHVRPDHQPVARLQDRAV